MTWIEILSLILEMQLLQFCKFRCQAISQTTFRRQLFEKTGRLIQRQSCDRLPAK